jgi:hypothetical protein
MYRDYLAGRRPHHYMAMQKFAIELENARTEMKVNCLQSLYSRMGRCNEAFYQEAQPPQITVAVRLQSLAVARNNDRKPTWHATSHTKPRQGQQRPPRKRKLTKNKRADVSIRCCECEGQGHIARHCPTHRDHVTMCHRKLTDSFGTHQPRSCS